MSGEEMMRESAATEATFREVNEAIGRGQWPGEGAAMASFCCECARLHCTQIIELSVDAYERLRGNPRRFVVAVGHEQPELESVVERAPGYVIVEKRAEAGAVAEETDPRA